MKMMKIVFIINASRVLVFVQIDVALDERSAKMHRAI